MSKKWGLCINEQGYLQQIVFPAAVWLNVLNYAASESKNCHCMQVAGHSEILQGNPTLKQRLKLREPYITVLNLQQVRTLRKMRNQEGGGIKASLFQLGSNSELSNLNTATEYPAGLEDTLILTMKGIAVGMQNTE